MTRREILWVVASALVVAASFTFARWLVYGSAA